MTQERATHGMIQDMATHGMIQDGRRLLVAGHAMPHDKRRMQEGDEMEMASTGKRRTVSWLYIPQKSSLQVTPLRGALSVPLSRDRMVSNGWSVPWLPHSEILTVQS